MTQLDIDSYKQRITKVTGSTKGADGIFWQHFVYFVTCFQHTATQCGYLSFFIVPYRAVLRLLRSPVGRKVSHALLSASTPKHELMMSLMCQMLGPCLDSASNYLSSIIYSITPFVIPESF